MKRNLYLTNLSAEEALAKYMKALDGLLVTKTELVPVTAALDRITAQSVYARYNSPLYDSAAMDGIAVIAAHTKDAHENNPVTIIPDRDFIIVDTGDPIKPPYDAVIMAEDLVGNDDGTIVIRAAAAPWQHVRPIGEDIVAGEMIIPSYHKIRPIDMGVLVSGGIDTLEVITAPKVAIFPTGTEMVQLGITPEEGQIIESNSYTFEALVAKDGGLPTRFPPIADDYEAIKAAIHKAADDFDAIIINAGSSAGTEDYTVHVLREIGEVIVHGVAIKPGKPTILAIVKGKPVIGLPGYPVSAYIAYETFVTPTIKRLAGTNAAPSKIITATLTRRLVSSLKYKEYVRVKVGSVDGKIIATPLARGAGSAMSLVRADGFCIIDQNAEGAEAGEMVSVHLNQALSQIEKTIVCIGSHDLILDIIADMLPGTHDGIELSSSHVGSMGGLLALKRGETHLAPTHLLDEKTGTYNVEIIRQLFGSGQMALIKGVGRTQGIMVAPGNPLGIKTIADLKSTNKQKKIRYINRQRGAGTRVLFDYRLQLAGLDLAEIEGYDREAATHMAVAAAIKSGSADAGMGILSAAKAMGLDFIPVGDEEYDFALPAKFLSYPMIQAFMEVLTSPAFKEKVAALGGYTTEHSGEIIKI